MEQASTAFPKRKQLRLSGYDYSQCNAYFVTVCLHNRIPLFGTIQKTAVGAALCGRPNRPDQMAANWLLELNHRFPDASIDYYCIMPDHIHFILILNRKSKYDLPHIMNWYKTMTTNEYIRGVKSGLYAPFHKHFWQRSYYDHVIRNDTDLREIREYIENNPLRWLHKKQGHE